MLKVTSICFAVFVFILVVEHREIRLVTTLCDVVVLYRLQYGTSWFVSVRAVREAALLGKFKDFLEIARQLLAFHVEGAKALDAWSVDKK